MPRVALIAAPLHAFALPRHTRGSAGAAAGRAPGAERRAAAEGMAVRLVAFAFAVYAFVPSGLSASSSGLFRRAGIDAASVVAIGAAVRARAVAARIGELRVRAPHSSRSDVARALRSACCSGLSCCSRCSHIDRGPRRVFRGHVRDGRTASLTMRAGTVPLALFGAAGFTAILVGRIGAHRPPFSAIPVIGRRIAPLALAFVAGAAPSAVPGGGRPASRCVSFVGFRQASGQTAS